MIIVVLSVEVRVEFVGFGDRVVGVVRSMYSREGDRAFVCSGGFGRVLCRSMSLPDEVLIELFVSSAGCTASSDCLAWYLFTVEGSLEVICTWCVDVRVR